ncbi:MAG: hemagglutinin repeat-containing protein [Solidesulfovibrio sp.]
MALVARDAIRITGSQVVGVGDILMRGRDITIDASLASDAKQSTFKNNTSGVMGTSPLSVSIGSASQSLNQSGVSYSTEPSLIRSTTGDIIITAGETYTQRGSIVEAANGTFSLKAKQAAFLAQDNPFWQYSRTTSSQSGFTLQLTNPITSALLSGYSTLQNMAQTNSPVMQGVGGLTLGLAGVNALSAYGNGKLESENANKLAKQGDPKSINDFGGVSLGVSYGSQQAKAMSYSSGSNSFGSSVSAANIVLQVGDAANPSATALIVQGSDLIASDTFYAKVLGKALVTAATNNEASISNNSSSGFSAGVSVSLGTKGVGVSANGSVNKSQGKSSGSSVENVFSHIGGGKLAILDVSDDLDVLGGVVAADRVLAKIGGNLRITTPQDRADYTSQQSSLSAGVSIPLYGYAAASASLDMSTSSGSSHMVSAGAEQAGIRAGSGGFNIVVDKDTTLIGAVISSLADESFNRLVTRDLFVTDLQNTSSASASTTGFSMSSSFFTQGMYGALQGISKNLLGLNGDSQSQSGSTLSAVSPGTILLTGLSESAAEEKIAALNRDAFNSNTPVTGINVQEMLEQQALSQKMKAELFKQGSILLDASYNKVRVQEQGHYKVQRNDKMTGERRADYYDVTPVTSDDLKNPEYKQFFVNGLFTSIPDAVELAIDAKLKPQDPIILLYDKPATNILGELLAGVFEIGLGEKWGWSNYAKATADVMESRKGLETIMVGYSDGASVLNSAAQILQEGGSLGDKLYIRALGGPVKESEFIDNLSKITNSDNIKFLYFKFDIVPVVFGGNDGYWWNSWLTLFDPSRHLPRNAYTQETVTHF